MIAVSANKQNWRRCGQSSLFPSFVHFFFPVFSLLGASKASHISGGVHTNNRTTTVNKVVKERIKPLPQTRPGPAGSNRRGAASDAEGHRPALRSGRWDHPDREPRTRPLWPDLLPVSQCHPSWAGILPEPCDSSWVGCRRSGMLWRTVHLFPHRTRWRGGLPILQRRIGWVIGQVGVFGIFRFHGKKGATGGCF